MPRIRQLDSHVADLISAGEVVERPASVVKELMENAIDAGATRIIVEIQRGGMSLIRVTDNGCGISSDDVETAFLRHATSKIQTEQDLESIYTLGFRGEALAVISAVSRMEVMTRETNAELGVALEIEAGVVNKREEIGSPQGTTMVVRDLFFNTPARLKFMKKDAAEGAMVFSVLQKVAMAHPDVSVQFIRNGKQELLTAGDGALKDTMFRIFGRDIALGLMPVSSEEENITVRGFVSIPSCCRGSRNYQYISLNGRPIVSRMLTVAVEEAYKNQMMVGKFPACVLQIEIKANRVDVNVHPSKQEVKFLNDKAVFDAVYQTVLWALKNKHEAPQLNMKPSHIQTQIVVDEKHIESKEEAVIPTFAPTKQVTGMPMEPVKYLASNLRLQNETANSHRVSYETPHETFKKTVLFEKLENVSVQAKEQEELVQETLPMATQKDEEHAKIAPWRMIGELFHAYILVEESDTFLMIDKHAAHERLNFDRMKAQGYEPMAQTLLEPIALSLLPDDYDALQEQLHLLEEFGFEVEEFGGNTLMVRQIPFDILPEETGQVLEDMAKKLRGGQRLSIQDARDYLLRSMACKASVRAGEKQDETELLRLVEAVIEGRVQYCPHGRPVAIRLTKEKIERQIGRS